MGKLFSHGGGGKTTTTENKTENQESWLQRNPQYQQMETNAINEANNFNMPLYQMAGENDYLTQGKAGIAQGVDTTPYKTASDYMTSQGQGLYQSGTSNLANYQSIIDRIGGMGQSDYQQALQSEYNSDLVKSQIAGYTSDINDQLGQFTKNLNEAATASGNMGNSRAGVAQGVAEGQAQKAIGSASVQYRTNEETNAFNRLQTYLSNQMNAATAGANLATQQQGLGLNMYGQGMNYLNQYNQANQQNYQNLFTLGQYQYGQDQAQLDMQRQNQIIQQSPALTRLGYFNQTLLPTANLGMYGASQGTTVQQAPATGGSLFGAITGVAGAVVGGIYGGTAGAKLGGSLGGAVGNAV